MRDEKLRQDRLPWVIVAFGLMMYAGLGTLLVVFAVSK